MVGIYDYQTIDYDELRYMTLCDVTHPELLELQTVTRSLLVTSERSSALRSTTQH